MLAAFAPTHGNETKVTVAFSTWPNVKTWRFLSKRERGKLAYRRTIFAHLYYKVVIGAGTLKTFEVFLDQSGAGDQSGVVAHLLGDPLTPIVVEEGRWVGISVESSLTRKAQHAASKAYLCQLSLVRQAGEARARWRAAWAFFRSWLCSQGKYPDCFLYSYLSLLQYESRQTGKQRGRECKKERGKKAPLKIELLPDTSAHDDSAETLKASAIIHRLRARRESVWNNATDAMHFPLEGFDTAKKFYRKQ